MKDVVATHGSFGPGDGEISSDRLYWSFVLPDKRFQIPKVFLADCPLDNQRTLHQFLLRRDVILDGHLAGIDASHRVRVLLDDENLSSGLVNDR